MLRDRNGSELILGMYWDYEGEQWRNRSSGRFVELHATSAAPVDWDGDGDLDLLAGTAAGVVVRWENLGSAAEPAFAEDAEAVLAGGGPLEVEGGYAMLAVADWDQDGRWDLVLGSGEGAVDWARNVGTPTAPAFDALRPLVAPYQVPGERSGASAQVAVADLNGDGRVDLLVGDNQDEQVGEGMSEEQAARLEGIQDELGSLEDVMQALYGDDEEAKTRLDPERVAEFEALMEEYRSLTPEFRTHGRVWLYPRAAAEPPRP